MIRVGLDVSPLGNGHARRGVGGYTRLLKAHLEAQSDVEVYPWPSKNKVDLVHYPYFDLFTASLPFFKQRPTVVTIHDVIPLRFPKHYPIGIKGRVALSHQILALKNVKAVITDSKASQYDINRYLGVPTDKIHVTYLAANPALEVPSEAIIKSTKSKYKLPETYILYVGDINYNKNIPQLIKTLKYLPDEVHLVCVGANFYPHNIPEWSDIEIQVALSNVEARVHYLSDILSDATDELAAIYNSALAYVQPSLAEGFGLPVLEAMQCRVPVISADNSSLIEVAGSQAIMVAPEAESMASAVQTIREWSKTHRQDVIRESYKWSQNFSWEKTAQETKDVYQLVLS